ncbi:OmpA family protein [Euhalothece natronophila Z-M001]|uniref:OmpA family protein n=1 Tax=Euhalothece natronophila Z-M001 TaxID=522448 RepID=A0A5B8NSS6_9CHRO|nr:OmpA family protein [Euhalothece natronophila]QDZ41355.1 OmpA family protein [Euhalothece natronophila Z-M001]
MNPKTLKYSEIFSFLAFIFVIFFVLVRLDLLQTERVASQVPELEEELADAEEKADQLLSTEEELAAAEERITELEDELEEFADLEEELEEAQAVIEQTPEAPPLIVLSEREQTYRFPVGSAEISDSFQEALDDEIIPMLEEESERCNCDTIEIIGHTDNLPVGSGRSNLDDELIAAFGQEEHETLVPGSNLDLGMMRALSIVSYLKQAQEDGALEEIEYFLPYSAGQMLNPDYTLDTSTETTDDERRRRIEMRLLQSSAWNQEINNNDR